MGYSRADGRRAYVCWQDQHGCWHETARYHNLTEAAIHARGDAARQGLEIVKANGCMEVDKRRKDHGDQPNPT